MKPKLLLYSDAGQPTGFEKITRGLVTYLNPRFDITVAGIGYFGQPDNPYPCRVRPATLTPSTDYAGATYAASILKEEKPDLVVIVQDVWNAMPLAMMMPRELPKVLITLPDSPNIKWIYGLGLGLFSRVITPTYWGAAELSASVQSAIAEFPDDLTPTDWINLGNDNKLLTVRSDRLARFQNEIDVIPLGYEPRSPDGAGIKQLLGIPIDKFIILNVNTNSFRKNIDLMLAAFKRLDRSDSHLVLHCQGDQKDGWDIRQLAKMMGIEKRLTVLTKPMSESELCNLYSLAHIQVNVSTGEGWGYPAIEGAMWANVPQLVPDWAATREIWGPASKIASRPMHFHYSNINTLHCKPKISDLVDKIHRVLNGSTKELYTQYKYKGSTWQVVAEDYGKLFELALAESDAKVMSKQDILISRTREIKTEALVWLDRL